MCTTAENYLMPQLENATLVVSSTDTPPVKNPTPKRRTLSSVHRRKSLLYTIRVLCRLIMIIVLFVSIVGFVEFDIDENRGRNIVAGSFVLAFVIASILVLVFSDYKDSTSIGNYISFIWVLWARALFLLFVTGFYLPTKIISPCQDGLKFRCGVSSVAIVVFLLALCTFILSIALYIVSRSKTDAAKTDSVSVVIADKDYHQNHMGFIYLIRVFNLITLVLDMFSAVTSYILFDIQRKPNSIVSGAFILVFTIASLITVIVSDYKSNKPIRNYLKFMQVFWAKELFLLFLSTFYLPTSLRSCSIQSRELICVASVLPIIAVGITLWSLVLALILRIGIQLAHHTEKS